MSKPDKAKQALIDNYLQKKAEFKDRGYTEKSEIISVVKANIMAFVTAGPIAVLCIILFHTISFQSVRVRMISFDRLLLLSAGILLFIVIHELLHGLGWMIGGAKRADIYIGVMWKYLTPYCHCKRPLKRGAYLFGALLPLLVCGLLVFAAAWVSGNYYWYYLSIVNIIVAGGDTTIALQAMKYNKDTYFMDEPVAIGFTAFVKE